MYKGITLLCTGNYYNTVNQLYSNKFFFLIFIYSMEGSMDMGLKA